MREFRGLLCNGFRYFWASMPNIHGSKATGKVDVAVMRPEPNGDDAAVCVGLVAEAAGSGCKVTLSIKTVKLINRTIKTARAMMANRLEMDGRTGGGGGRGIVG